MPPTDAPAPAAAPAAPPPAAAEPAAAPAEADEAPVAEPTEGGDEEAAPATEPTEGEPAPPADPPRIAAAKKLLAKAEAKEKAAKAAEEALESERQTFTKEVERVKGVLTASWPAFELGRDLTALKGQPPARILARLKAAGIELDARQVASAVLEGDEDDRPLTRKELAAIREQERKDAEAQTEKKRQEAEGKAQQTRAQQEAQFVGLVESTDKAPSALKLIKALDEAGQKAVLKDAWKAVAKRQASQVPFTTYDLLADVEEAAQARLTALGLAPAPPAPGAPNTAAAGAGAVSNKTAASKGAGKQKQTHEDRWDEALRELS